MEKKDGRILVFGGTGAIGVYLVPELLKMGYTIDVVSLEEVKSTDPKLTYETGDVLDDCFFRKVIARNYDVVIDFMIYPTEVFEKRAGIFLENTMQYIFLSSYRVYANEQVPITETAPQLYDISKDSRLLASDDYAIKKSKGEDILEWSGHNNWTVIRPAITYSKRRFQLVTLEGNTFVNRALAGKKVLVPQEALNVQATMTWAGDVARMIARLVLNPKAYGEHFNVSTSEHHTWGEIAEYYKKIIGLNIVPVDKETFLKVIEPDPNEYGARWQLEYDRLYDRIIDNTKVLKATGLSQDMFMPLYEGLEHELCALPQNVRWITGNEKITEQMDAYFESC